MSEIIIVRAASLQGFGRKVKISVHNGRKTSTITVQIRVHLISILLKEEGSGGPELLIGICNEKDLF